MASSPAPPKQAVPVPPAPIAPVKEIAPVVRETSREAAKEASRQQDVPFSGPSFLGLSSGSSESSAEYLLEDEASSSGRGKMIAALLVLAIAAALLGWKWHFGSFPWQSASSTPAATTTAQSNAPAANMPTETSNTGTSAAQNPTDSTNLQNAAPAPAQSAPAAQPADNSAAQPVPDSSAKNTSDATAKTPASNTAQSSDQSSSDQAADKQAGASQAADKAAADQPKQTVAVKPAPKPAPRRAAVADDDSPQSEAAALLTQGERYLNGDGVPQNCGRAQDSLRSAADRGSFQAVSDLATMYSTGHCVKKDLPTAYRWFVKALHQQPSNNRISTDLQVLWNQMTPEEKQVAMQK